MRVGSVPPIAPDYCGCNLCLVLARVASICHNGGVQPPGVAFATDRLRVLFGELLDIRARELLAANPPGGNLGPPPVAAGGGPATTGPLAFAEPVGAVAPEPPPEAPGASGVKTEEGEGEKKEVQAPEEEQALLNTATPGGETTTPVATPAAPPSQPASVSSSGAAGLGWPTSTAKEAPQASSKAIGLGATAPPVKAAPARVPIKAAPRLPPSAASLPPPPPKAVLKSEASAPRDEDEYTYESPEEEELEEDPPEEVPEPPGPSRPVPEASITEDKREPLPRRDRRQRSRSGQKAKAEEKKSDRDRSRRRRRSRSRSRKRERRSSREVGSGDGREGLSRDTRRPRSPDCPPSASHYAAKGEGKGKQKGKRVKKSKGKKREARWQDIQSFGPSKRRKRRREDHDRRGERGGW